MIEIFHEPCHEWLAQQKTASVGAVVTDPPYWLQGSEDLTPYLNRVLGECLRVSKGPVIIINPIQWEFEKEAARRRPCAYNPRPDNVGLWVMTHGGSRGGAPIYVWRGPEVGSFEIELPTEAISGTRASVKPVGLFMRLIRETRGAVLDPFMGYGTAGIACQNLGRSFIGIENNRATYEAARKTLIPQSREQKKYRDGSPGSYARSE